MCWFRHTITAQVTNWHTIAARRHHTKLPRMRRRNRWCCSITFSVSSHFNWKCNSQAVFVVMPPLPCVVAFPMAGHTEERAIDQPREPRRALPATVIFTLGWWSLGGGGGSCCGILGAAAVVRESYTVHTIAVGLPSGPNGHDDDYKVVVVIFDNENEFNKWM